MLLMRKTSTWQASCTRYTGKKHDALYVVSYVALELVSNVALVVRASRTQTGLRRCACMLLMRQIPTWQASCTRYKTKNLNVVNKLRAVQQSKAGNNERATIEENLCWCSLAMFSVKQHKTKNAIQYIGRIIRIINILSIVLITAVYIKNQLIPA